MFCNQCGTQTPDNYKFCPACGTILLSDEERSEITVQKTEKIQTHIREREIAPLSDDVINEKRNSWQYRVTYTQGHSLYKKWFNGVLDFNRERKQSNITFHADEKKIEIVMPLTSLIGMEVITLTRGFIKKEHRDLKIKYVDERGITQMPVFEVDEEKIEDIFEHYKLLKNELIEPVVHSITTRDGVKALLVDVMSPLMHHNEATLWSQNEVNENSKNRFDISKYVTNYRVFAFDNLDDVMLKSSFLSDVDDVVVVNRHIRSESRGTSYIVGGYGNNTFGGIMPSHSSGDSNTVGDMVFMRYGKPYLVIGDVPDPDGVITMVKSVMRELYPRN